VLNSQQSQCDQNWVFIHVGPNSTTVTNRAKNKIDSIAEPYRSNVVQKTFLKMLPCKKRLFQ
jgi:hypothetical protein